MMECWGVVLPFFKAKLLFPGSQNFPRVIFWYSSDRIGDKKAWVRNILNGLRATRRANQKCITAMEWKQQMKSFWITILNNKTSEKRWLEDCCTFLVLDGYFQRDLINFSAVFIIIFQHRRTSLDRKNIFWEKHLHFFGGLGEGNILLQNGCNFTTMEVGGATSFSPAPPRFAQ